MPFSKNAFTLTISSTVDVGVKVTLGFRPKNVAIIGIATDSTIYQTWNAYTNVVKHFTSVNRTLDNRTVGSNCAIKSIDDDGLTIKSWGSTTNNTPFMIIAN